MKKIPTLFKRDATNPSRITEEINADCQWVFDGEGFATRKFDGTACAIIGGNLYKRYDCKKGRTPPPNAIPCDEPDSVTGHWPHWVPVGDGPEDKWHIEGFSRLRAASLTVYDGTYELLHPKFQGRDSSFINPEHVDQATLVKHGSVFAMPETPINFERLKAYFHTVDYEGIVWHHQDGRMAKIKARDFGIKRI